MFIFTGINAKVLLTDLVSDTIFDGGTKHHLVTLHEVDHGILQLRNIILVYSVELDVLISDDLDSLVAFDEVDEASDVVEAEVVRPSLVARDLIQLDLEEEDVARASGHQDLVVVEVHLAEIAIVDVIKLQIFVVSGELVHVVGTLDSQALSLAVEGVDLLLVAVIEGLVWEVFP